MIRRWSDDACGIAESFPPHNHNDNHYGAAVMVA